MKRSKIFLTLLALIIVTLGTANITAFATVELPTETSNKEIYLSENEVFESLANTFDDTKLQAAIDSKTRISPLGAYIESFDSDDYSEYTNEQYGGMYLNDKGILTICYVKDSQTLHDVSLKSSKIKRNFSSAALTNADNETVVEQYSFKAVKYSEAELLSAYNIVNEVAQHDNIIQSASVDICNNRIIVGIESKSNLGEIQEKLSAIEGMYAIEILGEDDAYQDVATINGTSAINNGTISSTPAGKVYCTALKKYGIVTCGHGWSVGNNVYSGSTKIGSTKYRYYDGKNDSSFFVLNSGHKYKDVKYDEFDSRIPVVGSTLTLRGYVSGRISDAKVSSTNYAATTNGKYFTGMIKCDKAVKSGDSGGGAIGGYIDGGRTAVIVAINKAANSSSTLLIKGKVICDAY